MAKAGYCQQCGKNVWLKEDGGCQFGHPSSSIDNVYETATKPVRRRRTLLLVSLLILFIVSCPVAGFLGLFIGIPTLGSIPSPAEHPETKILNPIPTKAKKPQIVYWVGEDKTLYRISTDGTEKEKILQLRYDDFYGAVSPDGTKIAYIIPQWVVGHFNGPNVEEAGSLWVADLKNKTNKKVGPIKSRCWSTKTFSWTEDSKSIVYITRQRFVTIVALDVPVRTFLGKAEICKVDIDTGRRKVLKSLSAYDTGNMYIDWADKDKLCVSKTTEWTGEPTLTVYDYEMRKKQEFTLRKYADDPFPRFSPDRNSIIYSTCVEVDEKSGQWYEKIILKHLRTDRKEVLLKTNNRERIEYFAWLPNGKEIVYSIATYSTIKEVGIINVKTGKIRKKIKKDMPEGNGYCLIYDHQVAFDTSYGWPKKFAVFDMNQNRTSTVKLNAYAEIMDWGW